MSLLSIGAHLNYQVPRPMDILLQLEAADGYGQTVLASRLDFPAHSGLSRIAGQDGVGERIWFNTCGNMVVDYSADVMIDRHDIDFCQLDALPTNRLDGEATRYLMPSTYCPAFDFVPFVQKKFHGLSGGTLVMAMRDWILNSFEYVIGASNHRTTATETFVQRQGVCRDFTHVLISLCRAAAIPARFASVYAPNVKPQDFHAVAEVYLDGYWYLVDPTGMASADKTAVIGVGCDAADVAFMTSIGMVSFVEQSVEVQTKNASPVELN